MYVSLRPRMYTLPIPFKLLKVCYSKRMAVLKLRFFYIRVKQEKYKSYSQNRKNKADKHTLHLLLEPHIDGIPFLLPFQFTLKYII